ncbi:MAG: prolyl oligopeptidase family serine peptidase [Clostridia bacterium]|nr:prolyl oligopeptidase family serine peptidase [Clostridia bacterium]
MKSENAFIEFETDEPGSSPEVLELNIISGGCRLYGYMLIPDKRISGPYPAVIMSHGFPGYTTNNDIELALMRTGCVVIHMNHRGAWGSEGNYLFTNLKDDLIAIAKWAHNPAVAEQYDIDTGNIFLAGHSMGGQSVLNAAKELPFIKGVAALAAYDIGAAFRYGMEKDLFLMIETEGQCLKMNSAGEVYENALNNRFELAILNGAEKLAEHNVLLIEAESDTVAPPDKMLRPLYDKLKSLNSSVAFESVPSGHSFAGQRMKLTKILSSWMEKTIG